PSWVMNALGGIPSTIDPTIEVAGKTVSGTMIDLLLRPEVLERATQEFHQQKACHGAEPMLPADFAPPIHLPWPDYISGPHGTRDWLSTPQ
ncbi:MAG TPA: amidohydrolase, partial [Candidatus Nesterenkonia stercoripullorum]|nr:amidohydrolase [Candidatus Nesterenkonia stercoripullorum]